MPPARRDRGERRVAVPTVELRGRRREHEPGPDECTASRPAVPVVDEFRDVRPFGSVHPEGPDVAQRAGVEILVDCGAMWTVAGVDLVGKIAGVYDARRAHQPGIVADLGPHARGQRQGGGERTGEESGLESAVGEICGERRPRDDEERREPNHREGKARQRDTAITRNPPRALTRRERWMAAEALSFFGTSGRSQRP